jgi:hypothetical protein
VSFAPILDSPSAVGDEGRPRATSLAVVSIVLAAFVTAVGYRLGQWDLLLSLGTFTGMAAAGLALLDRERFVHRLFGHALLTWFGMPIASLVVLSPVLGGPAIAVTGFALALFGLTATWSDAGDKASLRGGLYASGRTTVATWLWLVVGLLVVGVATILVAVPSSGEASPRSALVGFCAVLVVASPAVLVGVRWLPVRELAPRRRRPDVAATVRRLQAGTGVVLATAVVVGLAAAAGMLGGLPAVVAPVSRSRVAVAAVVGVAGTVFLAGTLAGAARAVARRADPGSRDRLAAALAGLPLAVVGLIAITVDPLFGLVVVAAVFGSQFLLVVALAVTYVASILRIVPDRTGGPAMTAAGLVVAAIPLASLSTPLAVACVAVACLAWDLTTFGLGVTAELGHRPDTRRLVVVHGLVSVAVGSLVVLAVVGLDTLRGAVPAAPVAAVVVATGALLVVATVRG